MGLDGSTHFEEEELVEGGGMREKNIAYCVALDPKTKKNINKTKLTARQYYYCNSGFIRAKDL